MATYAETGIHLDDARRTTERLEEIVARARGAGALADVGAFGGMFHLGVGGEYTDPVLVASTDGIGTKVKIAVGARSLRHARDRHRQSLRQRYRGPGARPLFFLDYLALHRADPEVVTAIVGGVVDACAAAGCALLGGETAEMPDVYPPGELDLAGFIVGVMDRSAIGVNGAPAAGDVLLGLPSTGLHTNGYSLARRALPAATWGDFDPDLNMTVGEALLTPHRSYLAEIQKLTTSVHEGLPTSPAEASRRMSLASCLLISRPRSTPLTGNHLSYSGMSRAEGSCPQGRCTGYSTWGSVWSRSCR